jgi:hypothetical protein
MNEAIELALCSWYPKDHLLHYDLHHPLGKLVGEWGELLDDYMKHLYKPGYEFKPLDELIDIWYYVRILSYQNGALLETAPIAGAGNVEYQIACAINETSEEFKKIVRTRNPNKGQHIPESIGLTLNSNYSILGYLCSSFDLTITQLTEASWEKLKPGSERGKEWMKGRE